MVFLRMSFPPEQALVRGNLSKRLFSIPPLWLLNFEPHPSCVTLDGVFTLSVLRFLLCGTGV
jgi:hypothetical protein